MADVALRVAGNSALARRDAAEFDVWTAPAQTSPLAYPYRGPRLFVATPGGGPGTLFCASATTLGAATSASTGQVLLSAVSAATLSAATSSSAAQVLLKAAAAATLGNATSASTGAVLITCMQSVTLADAVSSGTATTGVPTLSTNTTVVRIERMGSMSRKGRVYRR